MALQSSLAIRELYFAFVELTAQIHPDFEKAHRSGPGAEAGILVDLSENWRAALLGGITEFNGGQRGRVKRAALSQRYSPGKDSEINLDLIWLNGHREAVLGFGIYF